MDSLKGHHECQLFTGRIPEAAESEFEWKRCEKNPGHEKFITVPDFLDNHLPGIQDEVDRAKLKSLIDCTVRLRVRWTSLDRTDGDHFADCRGTDKLRVGTGFIGRLKDPVTNKPCPCMLCRGKVAKKQWEFDVHTAHHVVHNTEEAKSTAVDFFYDDTDNDVNGRMKSAWGLEVNWIVSDRDISHMTCVTCDEGLGERIESSFRRCGQFSWSPSKSLCDLDLLQPFGEDSEVVMIVSHPHGQPKQITVGEIRLSSDRRVLREYTTPTCPGCSGASVFMLDRGKNEFYFDDTVHSGTYFSTRTERFDRGGFLRRLFNRLRGYKIHVSVPLQQLNYGHEW